MEHRSRRSLRAPKTATGFVLILCALLMGAPVAADRPEESEVSPVRKIRPNQQKPDRDRFIVFEPSLRRIDGRDNNPYEPAMGSAFTPLNRWAPPVYDDGTAAMVEAGRPSPRMISNLVNAQVLARPNRACVSDFFWQWGQFLDHDIDLTDGTDPPEPANIAVPTGDPEFDPDATGSAEMAFNRSVYDETTGGDPATPRQQLNQITGWIDASNVYGSDPERAEALRLNDGSGRLRTSAGDLLPYNEAGLPNAGGASATLFLAGDLRANEQAGLTALHTLFVREHNRLAALIAARDPGLSGEEIYQRARFQVGVLVQVITYREFLPILLGRHALGRYRGYDPGLDARIANIFSTAAYRFGHSLIGTHLLRLDAAGREIPEGHLALRDAFFAPHRLRDEGGIEPLLRGLAGQVAQTIDVYVVDDLRNFLFGAPGAGGFDLAALNIQRGRDHGLPSYNEARLAFGLSPALDFADLTSDPAIQDRLAAAYDSVEEIDLWVGGLAEDHWRRAQVGRLFGTILKKQFGLLRDGDRFWYQNVLSAREARRMERTRLSDIIRRNTTIGRELARDVFHVRPGGDCGQRRGRDRDDDAGHGGEDRGRDGDG